MENNFSVTYGCEEWAEINYFETLDEANSFYNEIIEKGCTMGLWNADFIKLEDITNNKTLFSDGI